MGLRLNHKKIENQDLLILLELDFSIFSISLLALVCVWERENQFLIKLQENKCSYLMQQICVSWNPVNNKHENLFSISLESEQKQGRE